MFTLRVNDIKILNNTIGIVSDFISDATFHVTNEGLKLVAMDPANISPLVVWLGSMDSKDVSGRVFEVAVVLRGGELAKTYVEAIFKRCISTHTQVKERMGYG